jgi:hypothetical protein
MRPRVSLSLSLILALVGLGAPASAQDIIDLDLGMEDSLTVLSSQDRHLLRMDTFESRQNLAFGPGERLVYSVRYGIIRAGEATLEVGPPVSVASRECYHLIGTAASGDPFSSFFRVDDRMESWLDAEFILPWRFRKELNEGSFKAKQQIEIDQVNRTATYHDGKTMGLDPQVQDVLSALYWLRTMDLTPGTRVVIPTHVDKRNVNLEVAVLGRERIDTPAGEFDCLEVEPKLLIDTGLYDQEKGKLLIYLTDDRRKIPVHFKIKVFFGSLVLTLTDYQEGKVNGSVP